MRYQAIFFDADGVLIKNKFLFTDELKQDYGIEIEKTLPFFTGVYRQCSIGKADLKDELVKVIDDWGWKGTVEELVGYWFTKGTQIDVEALEYVRFIRDKGVRCYMATDQEEYRGEHLNKLLGDGQVFEHVFFSAQIGCSKKEPAFWDHVFEVINAASCSPFPDKEDRSRALFIDDDLSKVDAVASFGIDTYLYTNMESLKQWLNQYL